MLNTLIAQNLNEFINLLAHLSDADFTQKHPELSNTTIGEHTRHSIELFQCLLNTYDLGIVNYDKRERSEVLQNNYTAAIASLKNIIATVDKPNKTMFLEQGTLKTTLRIETNYFRELLYNWEHTIHHQALIKVALLKVKGCTIPESFGVAKSTLEYRLQCAP